MASASPAPPSDEVSRPTPPSSSLAPSSGPPSHPPGEPHLHPETSAPTSAAAASQDEKPVVPQSRLIPTRIGEDGVRRLPRQFESVEVEDLITLIASMLTRLMEHNDRVPLTTTSLTRFHSRAPPGISVRDYLIRIARFTNVEPCCLLILLHYVDRICTALPNFTISSLTVHRFVIASVAVSSKALSDSFCTNSRYARVGGVTLAEMNLLEKEFLTTIDWRLTTTGKILDQYYISLVRSHPAYRIEEAQETETPALMEQ